MNRSIRATFWDFGGVILASPFDALARYERDEGLPDGFIRGLNTVDPDTNTWARFERGEINTDEFCERFEADALAAGGRVDARTVIGLLHGEIRPEMVEALHRCRAAGLKTACLTNNFAAHDRAAFLGATAPLFDVVLESSKAGVRKPDLRFYELACELVGVTPHEVVYLDDLGRNLKPARAMGMTTIKVDDPKVALDELEEVLGFSLR